MLNRFLLLSVMAVGGLACSQQAEPVKYGLTSKNKAFKKKLEYANRGLVQKDSAAIAKFVQANGWAAKPVARGFWFEKLHAVKGDLVKPGDRVQLKYTLSLMDGYVCYSSDSLGLKNFKVGQGGVESGLEDAILLLAKGEKARVILPPYLAHGLLGDGKCIPPRATVVYELEVVELVSPNHAAQQ